MGKPFMTEEFNNIDKTKVSSEMLMSEIRNKLCINQFKEFESPEQDFAVKDIYWKYLFILEETNSGYRVGVWKDFHFWSFVFFVLVVFSSIISFFFSLLLWWLFSFLHENKLKKLVADARTNISELYSLSSSNQASLYQNLMS